MGERGTRMGARRGQAKEQVALGGKESDRTRGDPIRVEAACSTLESTRYEPVKYRSWGGSRAARLTSDAPAQHTGTCSAFPQLVVLVGADSIRPSIHPLPPLTPARQPASPLVATPLAHLVRSLDASTKSGGAARVRTSVCAPEARRGRPHCGRADASSLGPRLPDSLP
ncbi:hypothetical protein ACCO45_003199 [Purpureocillium lilacinum]|uniref:Uncharacterized protein n=1 Tax=Purpureocillium lilacinum TaxID=33203 RepID=A0ACC4E1Y9_PURLI